MKTAKEKFKEWFIEFAQENFAQVTTENAQTIWNAGHKEGRKETLEELGEFNDMTHKYSDGEELSDFRHRIKISDYIDTELKKMKSNEN